MLGLAVVAGDNSGIHGFDRQTVQARHLHRLDDFRFVGLAAAQRERAGCQPQGHGGRVGGNCQRRGLYRCVELERVVGDREFDVGCCYINQCGGLVSVTQRQTFFEFGRLHRVRETKIKHGLALRRLDRVLIELGLRHRNFKGRRTHFVFPLGERDVKRQCFAAQAHLEALTHWPVFAGLKF